MKKITGASTFLGVLQGSIVFWHTHDVVAMLLIVNVALAVAALWVIAAGFYDDEETEEKEYGIDD